VSTVDGRDISVVVPVRDCERYVAEALVSIITQSVPPAEVVVLDDGSVDGTAAVLERFGPPVRVLHQESAGLPATLNRAVAASTGAILAFLDADDQFTPTSLERRLERLDADDKPDAVFGRMEVFVSPDIDAATGARYRVPKGAQRVTMFQTMLIRRDAFERVGALDESYVTGANIDWMSRARLAGLRVAEIDDVVGRRRIHSHNMGITQKSRKHFDLLNIVRAHRQRIIAAERPDAGNPV
jgi:glycosyltransferase involved in cell wall biosynthesis